MYSTTIVSKIDKLPAESCMNIFCFQTVKQASDMKRLLNVKRVFLEDNIGIGKSTVLAALGLNAHIDCVAEPVLKWSHVRNGSQGDTINLLEMAYNVPLMNAFELQQVYSNSTMVEAHQTPLKEEGAKVCVMDRSLFSSDVFIDLSIYMAS
jgi:hypothetical protein